MLTSQPTKGQKAYFQQGMGCPNLMYLPGGWKISPLFNKPLPVSRAYFYGPPLIKPLLEF